MVMEEKIQNTRNISTPPMMAPEIPACKLVQMIVTFPQACHKTLDSSATKISNFQAPEWENYECT